MTPEHHSLSLRQMLDWIESVLPPGDDAAQSTGLHCLETLRSIDLDALPAFMHRTILERIERFVQDQAEAQLTWRVAERLFDSATPHSAAASRSSSVVLPARQLAFRADEGDVALHVLLDESCGSVSVYGQYLESSHSESGPSAFEVTLLSDDGPAMQTTTDELGEFSIDRIEPGSYGLMLSSPELNIIVPELMLVA